MSRGRVVHLYVFQPRLQLVETGDLLIVDRAVHPPRAEPRKISVKQFAIGTQRIGGEAEVQREHVAREPFAVGILGAFSAD